MYLLILRERSTIVSYHPTTVALLLHSMNCIEISAPSASRSLFLPLAGVESLFHVYSFCEFFSISNAVKESVEGNLWEGAMDSIARLWMWWLTKVRIASMLKLSMPRCCVCWITFYKTRVNSISIPQADARLNKTPAGDEILFGSVNWSENTRVWARKCAKSPQSWSWVFSQGGTIILTVGSSNSGRPEQIDPTSKFGTKFRPWKPKLVARALPYGENDTQWLSSFL